MQNEQIEQLKTRTLGLLHDQNNQSGVRVTFTKKDGSERKMLCTLVESKIPTDKRPKSVSESETPSTSGSAVRVFDLDIGEWRSFRWDSVTKVEV